MSGAWPPPAPSVWKVAMARPLKAARVVSTKPNSFSVSVWIATCTSMRSATVRQLSIAAGVVPQSSCSFSPQAPASTCSLMPAGLQVLPLPKKPRFIGKPSAACSMRPICHGPGVHGGGEGAVRRTGAAAHHGGDAAVERLVDLLRGDEMDVAVDAARGDDLAFAGDRLGARADHDVDLGLDVGVAGLADADDAAVPEADIGLHDAPVVDDQGVGDDGVDRALRARALALAHAVADHLAAAELHLLAVGRVVLLDLDEELGVGQPHLVAHSRAEHVGIGRARDAGRALVGRADLGDRTELARDLGLETVAFAAAHVGREPHGARLAGLEAHGGAGGDVEPHALGALAVEPERIVGLEEMIVAADLDRPVAGVGDLERDRIAALVELQLARSGEDFTRLH